MRILICGANGFIGQAIAARLRMAGHTIVRGVRRPRGDGQSAEVDVDYARDQSVDDWLPKLSGIEAVVNAVGILVERRGQSFENIHHRAPQALFAACARAGVKRVLQISALGAADGDTPYFATKRAADEFLMAQPLEWQIVRPSVVYGANGSSARLFRMLASLPAIGLPGKGTQLMQPVHIDDLTDAVLRLLDPATPPGQCVALVGRTAVEYREMLRIYRAAMGFPRALQIAIPAGLVSLGAHMLGWIPGAVLTPDTWKMLRAGNAADAGAITRLLGRPPRGVHDFIAGEEVALSRHEALATWRNPLLRATLAFVWIVSGLISVGVFPVSQSLEMLARLGLTSQFGVLALYGAAFLDVALGVGTLLLPCRRLWLAQIALIVVYTLVIAWALPEYLVHPFGPLLKNLPILAILMLLLAEETRA